MVNFGPKPIGFYLVAFGVAVALPVLALSGYMMWSFAKTERVNLENNVTEVNEQIVFAVERQHVADIAALRALATSPTLREDNIRDFEEQAVAVVDSTPAFTDIVLRDRAGRILADTGYGFGKALPAEFIRPDLAPPQVSGVITGKTLVESAYYISTPVVIAGEERYFLIARVALARLADLMKEQMVDAGYFASIADDKGRILARSTESDKYFGHKLNGVTGPVTQTYKWSGVNPQGIAVYGIVSPVHEMGWAVTTGVSQQLLHVPLQRSLAWFTVLGLATVTVGCAIAFLFSRVLANAIGKLVHAAAAVGEDREIPDIATAVAEANVIGKAFQEASERLRQNAEDLAFANRTLERKVEARTAELAAKTELLETTMSNMDQGIVVIGPDGEIRLFNKTAADLNSVPVEFLNNRPTIAETIAYRRANGAFEHTVDDLKTLLDREGLVPGKTLVHERERRNGDVIEVRTVPLADGSLVRTFTDVTLRKHAERHLEYLARHDSLTQLPNRVLFRERLEQAIAYNRRHGTSFSVLFIDLDHFKQVNDRYGHAVGDNLLMEVSARFKSALRMEDTVARLGGDEFAILQAGAADIGDPKRLARRLLEEVAGVYRIGDIDIAIGLSIGIARCPANSTDVDDLLKKADVALYQAKRQGRGTFRLADIDDAQRKAS